MAKKKQETKVSLSGRQVILLALCIAAIAVISLVVGYFSGKMYNKGASLAQNQVMAPKDIFKGITTKYLDPETVQKETTEEEKEEAKFSFHEKLRAVSDPAMKPLPKSTDPSMDNPIEQAPPEVKPKPPASKSAVAPKLKRAKVKTVKKRKRVKTASPTVSGTKKANIKLLTIQVGSFKLGKGALALVKKLKSKGYQAYVVPFQFKGQVWRRVRVGVFKTPAAAKRTARKLEIQLKLPVLLVSYQEKKR